MAVMANTFSMTVLMILVGLSGQSSLAADIGIVHGATLGLFFAFSANGRSLILSQSSLVSANSMMLARIILVIPIVFVAYFLSVSVGVIADLAVVLVFRRIVEWLGEVHLSEMERCGKQKEATIYLVANALLLVIAFCWLMFDMEEPLLGLWLWAAIPLILNLKALIKAFQALSESLRGVYFSLLPHLGSSAIIGITVYVFRLFLLFLLGKESSGDLFTAFAIGGLLGSIFANALGASLTLYEQQSGKYHFPTFLIIALNGSLVLGTAIFIAAILEWPIFEVTGKNYFFWEALGLSLVGGVIMVCAQRIRFRLLQNDGEHDVFGPDVMMNILLLASIPFGYYLLGRESMTGLYLLSSILAGVFYLSYQNGEVMNELKAVMRNRIKVILGVCLLFPMFFQVSNGVFRDPSMYFNSGGRIMDLPIPLSVFACYLGIVLLGQYKITYSAFVTIFLTCVLMLVSILFAGSDQPVSQEAKLILMIQYILPMFGLVLGQMFMSSERDIIGIGKTFFWVLVVIVPLQLAYTWFEGFLYLLPSIWGTFSIYQHLQYVPVIIVSAYMVALFTLWQLPSYQIPLALLAVALGIYVSASLSMLAIGFLLIGLLIFALLRWQKTRETLPIVVFSLVAVAIYLYLQLDSFYTSYKFGSGPSSNDDEVVPQNIQERLHYWQFYINAVGSDLKTFLFGHVQPPGREAYPSAHNYYLDFVYNFGFIALIPLIMLIGYTLTLIFRCRVALYQSMGMMGVCMVVLFLLFADNSLKVGLRQPYPGIFTCFVWGLLLGQLNFVRKNIN